MHSDFDPELSFSSAAPILDKVFKAADSAYDEDNEKGNQYIMDYILNTLNEKEIKQLCSDIDKTKNKRIKVYQPPKPKSIGRSPNRSDNHDPLTSMNIYQHFCDNMEYFDDKHLGVERKINIKRTVNFYLLFCRLSEI